ncbi:hypothetical protein HY29_14175 [Hyphomonas beringensis]|uniref:Uncharacterized protein n=1 Tax=Hyphomonas beringensis TaxID=1280946 RepID=A0A062U229_9PROT|nr:hypothetical protein [Hyphomonas beringensis]KCZ54401.1 hypothetical protein HY29_14175 [Hyphomonas beringensis]
MAHVATDSNTVRIYSGEARADHRRDDKFPVWVRILIIMTLSCSLWAGIIAAFMAIL